MRLPNKRQSFWLLMAISAAAVWWPGLTGRIRGLSDPILAPLSGWLYSTGQDLRQQATNLTRRPAHIEAFDRMQQDLEAARGQLLAAQLELRRQTVELAEVTALRASLLGPRGRIIPARVLNRDAVAWRESLLVNMGQNVQIDRKMWASGQVRGFLDRGEDAAVMPGRWTALPLSQEPGRDEFTSSVLIGQVEQVGQVTSRIKLLTDPDSVVPGQLYDPSARKMGPNCLVAGVGPQRLTVKRVSQPPPAPGQRNSDEPPAKVGDLVLTAADMANLPGQLLIGVVVGVTRRDDDPLDYQLDIRPACDYAQLRRLYVIDPTLGSEPPTGAGEARR